MWDTSQHKFRLVIFQVIFLLHFFFIFYPTFRVVIRSRPFAHLLATL